MTLATSNACLAWPNYILPQYTGAITGTATLVTPAFSGGSWTNSPSNFTQGRLYNGARSTNATLTSTQFDVDFGEVRGIGLVAAIRHNMSRTPGTATWRIRHSADVAFATNSYDSGSVSVMTDTLQYQASSIPSHWTSTDFDDPPSHEDLAPYQSLSACHVFATQFEKRYLRVEFSDATNAAGYIDVGGIFAGPAWQVPNNLAIGVTYGWVDNTVTQRTKSGVLFAEEQPMQRTVTFVLDMLSNDQSFSFPFELAARSGKSRPVFFVGEPNSTKHAHRWSFMAVCEEVPAVEFPYSNFGKAAFRLTEIL